MITRMTIALTARGIGRIRHLGDTIWIRGDLTDEDGDPLTPNSQTITLRDPSGTIRDTDTTPTLLGTGSYDSKLVITSTAARGMWTVWWIVTKGTDQETEIYYFTVY